MRDRVPFSHRRNFREKRTWSRDSGGEKGKRSRDSLRVVSYRREGPLGPRRAGGLRAGAVRLGPGEVMDWHSTRDRQELVIMLSGNARVDTRRSARRARRLTLRAGQCAFLPSRTLHRVVNASKADVRYLYVAA